MNPGVLAIALQSLGAGATLATAAFVTAHFGLAAQGQYGLLRSWNDALITIAAVGLPQGLLHLQYRDAVGAGSLWRWSAGFLRKLTAGALVLAIGLWLTGWEGIATGADLPWLVLAAPAGAAHLLWRSLLLRAQGVVRYATATALPALLILVGVLVMPLLDRVEGFGPVLCAAAWASAVCSLLLLRDTRHEQPAPALRSEQETVLWSTSLHTWLQNAAAALLPAVLLSTAKLCGAPSEQVGQLSLGLHLYLAFAVLAGFLAPMTYDRLARESSPAATARRWAARITRPHVIAWATAGLVAGTAMLAAVVSWLRPPREAGLTDLIGLTALFAGAGAMAFCARLLTTALQAQGGFRELSSQAFWRLAAASCITAALAWAGHPVAAGGAALFMIEAASALRLWLILSRPAPRTRAPLVVVTTNYPYAGNGGETMFIGPEVPHLTRAFGTVLIVPWYAQGPRGDTPPGAHVDLGLDRERRIWSWWAYASAPLWPGFGNELMRALRAGGWMGVARVWRWTAMARMTHRWASRQLGSPRGRLFYTYWRGGATLALARLAGGEAPVVTRVHGYDVYRERFTPPFQPWESVYGQIDRCITVSQHGLDYLIRLGVPASRLMCSRLGSGEPSRLAQASSDSVLRILSCGAAISIKRTERIAAAVRLFAQAHPERQVEWTHFGGGPLLERVQDILRTAPENLRASLAGQVSHEVVLTHYLSQPVDIFVHLSSSEGLPMVLQEAMSFGVPVIATDVGGVREIVDASTGALLPSDPSPELVADRLADLLIQASETQRQMFRQRARTRWADAFDSQRNHACLAATLDALRRDYVPLRGETVEDSSGQPPPPRHAD